MLDTGWLSGCDHVVGICSLLATEVLCFLHAVHGNQQLE